MLDASWNPPTRAHFALLLDAYRYLSTTRGKSVDAVLLSFSVTNADKPIAQDEDINHRVQMMQIVRQSFLEHVTGMISDIPFQNISQV